MELSPWHFVIHTQNNHAALLIFFSGIPGFQGGIYVLPGVYERGSLLVES